MRHEPYPEEVNDVKISAREPTVGAWLRQCRIPGMSVVLLVLVLLVLGGVAAGQAAAYTNSWYCQDGNNVWCADPEGAHNWNEGQVKNEGGYPAYLCVGIGSANGFHAYYCSKNELSKGTSFSWYWGGSYAGDYPLLGSGLQDNPEGATQLIWSWFWSP